MRRLNLLSVLLITAAAVPAHAFVPLGAKWSGGTVSFRINPNFPDADRSGTAADQIEFIRCGATAWRDQSRANFRYNYLGTTTIARLSETDGQNVVFFSSSDGGDALAVTLFDGDNGVATSFDVAFFKSSNDNPNHWSGPGEPGAGEFDIVGVATHELGHGLGLDHTPTQQATMFASATGRALPMRTLHQDDRDGVESLYGLRTQTAPGVQITNVEPAEGPTAGGTEVVLTGVNFTYDSDSTLSIDGTALPGTQWSVETCSRIRILGMPAHGAGRVPIRVTNTIGAGNLPDAFRYGGPSPKLLSINPPEGPTSGGIQVTVSGENFVAGAVVTIDGQPLGGLQVVNSTTIRGSLPPSSREGPVDVMLTQGTDEASLPGGFSYNPYFLRVLDAVGVRGQIGLRVGMEATTPVALSSISFGVIYDESILSLIDVTLDGTEAEPAEFYDSNIDNASGVTTVGIVMSFGHSSPSFPAGEDVRLANLSFNVAPGTDPPTEVVVGPRDNVGQPPIELTFTKTGDPTSTRRRPLTADGRVTILPGIEFLRGDVNRDGRRDISDPVALLDRQFKGGAPVPCNDAADANDDGGLDISDVITMLLHLFQGSAPLPEPFQTPGLDPTTQDALDCDS